MTHDQPYHPDARERLHADPWRERHDMAYRAAGGRAPARQGSRTGGVPASALLGLGLALATGGALGYMALRQGSEGRPPDDAPRRSSRGLAREGRSAVAGRVVTINRPRAELYKYWRDFQNLASFMEAVESVRTEGERRQVWTLQVPGGSATVRTEITEDREGEIIAWRSVEGSDIETRGHVRFEDAPGGRGTRVEAEIAYTPPAGELGRLAAKLFQREPAIQARRELKRFKMLMEAGEIATAENRRAA